MNILAGFVLSVFGLALSLIVSILVMMKGWGLRPVSWWWIIGFGLMGHIIALSILGLAKKILKDQ